MKPHQELKYIYIIKLKPRISEKKNEMKSTTQKQKNTGTQDQSDIPCSKLEADSHQLQTSDFRDELDRAIQEKIVHRLERK